MSRVETILSNHHPLDLNALSSQSSYGTHSGLACVAHTFHKLRAAKLSSISENLVEHEVLISA